MTAISTYTAHDITPVQDLQNSLFDDFVSWIDRSEKTAKSYIKNLRQFMAWLKYRAITKPVRNDIISYRDWLVTEHEAIRLDMGNPDGWSYRTDACGNLLQIRCKPSTVAQYIRIVCQFFRWTAANGLYPDIASNIHAPKIRHDTHRKEALTASEVLAIEKSIMAIADAKAKTATIADKDKAGRIQRADEQGKRLYAMYLLTTNAGLRTIELSRANVKDLVTKSGQTWFYIWGKGHTEPDQKKAIAPEVAAALRDYIDSRSDRPTGSSPLFVSTGNRSHGKRIASTTISTMLKRAMQDAGFDDERITAHSLRHSTGTAVQEITGDLYATQKYMRHANPATTEIYLHNETEQQETGIAQQLYDLFHGIKGADKREELERILNRMTPEQIAQLAGIAAAMA